MCWNVVDAVKKNSKRLLARGVLRLNGTDDLTNFGAVSGCSIYSAVKYFYPKPAEAKRAIFATSKQSFGNLPQKDPITCLSFAR